MGNIYYSPENFGLVTVGEIDFVSGYEFDITAVWRRKFDGRIVYADDSGCSCPTPFEDMGIEDLTVAKPAELQAHLEQRAREYHTDYSDEADQWAMQIVNLMDRVVDPTVWQVAA